MNMEVVLYKETTEWFLSC